MEELKSCPFCGNTRPSQFIKLERFHKYPELTTYWRKSLATYGISCSNLECNAKVGEFLSQEDAIAAWNRRTSNVISRID